MASVREGVIVADLESRVVYLNPAAERLLDCRCADVEGRPLAAVLTLLLDGHREPVQGLVDALLGTGTLPRLPDSIGLADRGGFEVPVDLEGRRLRSPDGSVEGVVLTFRDVTQGRRTDEEARRLLDRVRAEREWLSLVLNSIADEVYFADAEGRYTYANPAALREFGHETVEGVEVRALIRRMVVLRGDGTARPIEEAPPLRALEGEVIRNEEQIVKTPRTGELRHRQVSAAPVRDAAGRIIGSVSVVRDVTDRKRAEEALREADRRKDVFLATLSHELRNPLAPIRTAAELLASPRVGPADLTRCKDIIGRQVAHMASLLDDLLDVSRLTRGELRLKKSRVALQHLLDGAIETARPLITAKRHTLKIEVPSALLLLEVDPVRITQAVSNLLVNAAKYTNPAGEIVLGSSFAPDRLTLFVRDTGTGLAAGTAERVFEMFFQIEPAKERGEGGLGVGLALVRALVEMHEGRVEVESAGLGRGSTFRIVLPPSVVVQSSSSSAAPEPTRVHEAERLSVLVADDNGDAADTLAMMLQLSGHDVHVAYGGAEAFELARRVQPAIALLDIGMPGMSGYELGARIRGEPWGERVALIAVTGWGEDEDKSKAREAGFDEHLLKPVDPTALDALLESFAGRGR